MPFYQKSEVFAASRLTYFGDGPFILSFIIGESFTQVFEADPSVSYRPVLHRFLEIVPGGDSPREQHTAVGKETGETTRA